MTKPLAIDLFCGLGGWTEGLLAEGYRVVGFDNERHVYGDQRYPAQLVLQDVLTIHGRQFKDAALIVASPPCQAYSYRAMPWKKAKALPPPDNALFEACFRIQAEAIEAAGHHIPLVVENVRGAQKWVGRSKFHFGSFHLWGDIPALMPLTGRKAMKGCVGTVNGSGKHREQSSWDRGEKVPGFRFDGSGNSFQSAMVEGHRRISEAHRSKSPAKGYGAVTEDGIKQGGIGGPRANGKGDAWFQDGAAQHGSKSPARKAASAMIAKIPLVLARHIAASWKPSRSE